MRAETFQNTVKPNFISGIKKTENCLDCYASVFITVIGEDDKRYMVPLKPIFCPSCGRRLRDE